MFQFVDKSQPMNPNGLPAAYPVVNLPTSVPRSFSDFVPESNAPPPTLGYNPHMVETARRAPGKSFVQPVQRGNPSLWASVSNAVFGGFIKTGTSNPATGNVQADDAAGAGTDTNNQGLGTSTSGGHATTGQSGVTRANSQ
jgi:hypothetical protein